MSVLQGTSDEDEGHSSQSYDQANMLLQPQLAPAAQQHAPVMQPAVNGVRRSVQSREECGPLAKRAREDGLDEDSLFGRRRMLMRFLISVVCGGIAF